MNETPDGMAAARDVARQEFRDGMAQLGAAVSVITTDGPAGRAGFTASAVCSVTDSPPTLLVCINRSASVYPAFTANGVLCVNVLGGHHAELSRLFGGKTLMAERFAVASWSTAETGAPVLDGAVVSFDCRVTRSVAVGTHDVLFCEALAVVRHAGTPGLAYFDRQYHALPVKTAK